MIFVESRTKWQVTGRLHPVRTTVSMLVHLQSDRLLESRPWQKKHDKNPNEFQNRGGQEREGGKRDGKRTCESSSLFESSLLHCSKAKATYVRI